MVLRPLTSVLLVCIVTLGARGQRQTIDHTDARTRTHYAAAEAGSTWQAKLITCLQHVQDQGGGQCEASGIIDDYTISTNIFSGVTQPVYLRLGGPTLTIASDLTVPANVVIGAYPGATISIASGKTLTIYGLTSGCTFTGPGSVVIRSATISHGMHDIRGDATLGQATMVVPANGDMQRGGIAFVDDPINPTISGFAEITMLMDGSQCDMWGRKAAGGDTDLWYRYATNERCDNWSSGTPSVFPHIWYPFVFKYGATYYLLYANDDVGGDIYLASSIDKMTWALMNRGNPVLTHHPNPDHWGSVLYNPSAVVVNGTIHFFIEAAVAPGRNARITMGYATSTFAAGPNFNTNLSQIIPLAGQPDIHYIPSLGAFILLYADFPNSGYWELRASTALLTDNLFLPSSWHKSENFIYSRPGHVTDPCLLDTTTGGATKIAKLILGYYYDQVTVNDTYQAWADLTMEEFYFRLVDDTARVILPPRRRN